MNDYSSPKAKNIQIQLPNGNIMNIPVDSTTASGTAGGGVKAMNISEEVNRSGKCASSVTRHNRKSNPRIFWTTQVSGKQLT